jgi:hypothetical protein
MRCSSTQRTDEAASVEAVQALVQGIAELQVQHRGQVGARLRHRLGELQHHLLAGGVGRQHLACGVVCFVCSNVMGVRMRVVSVLRE